jgi:hypothetical protein
MKGFFYFLNAELMNRPQTSDHPEPDRLLRREGAQQVGRLVQPVHQLRQRAQRLRRSLPGASLAKCEFDNPEASFKSRP